MGRIGASLSGFESRLLRSLKGANAAAAINSIRIATGLKINRPSDDPTGFIAVDQLTSRLNNVTATLKNVTAASSIVGQAQSNIDEIGILLDTIRTELLKDEDDSLTPDQKLASQSTIDTAINQINALAASKIDGRRVLDGSANFTVSGINNAQVSDIQASSLGNAAAPTLSGTVTVTATQGTLTLEGKGGSEVKENATFTLTGDRGAATISVVKDEQLSVAVARINAESHKTGITAAVNGNDIDLTTVDYGITATIAVAVTSGTLDTNGGNGDGTAQGIDATATINGQSLTGDGNRFTLNDNGFTVRFDVTAGFSGALDTITVSGDALSFSLFTDVGRTSTLAIGGLQSLRLGGLSGNLGDIFTGGTAAGLGTSTSLAIRIVDEAIGDLDRIEGAVDGFANAAVVSSDVLLTALQSDLQSSIDDYNKADTDVETLLLVKNQALATNAVAALSILNQQRSGVLLLLQQIAGF
jgi:flagellin-like hook-associated protein FlgL